MSVTFPAGPLRGVLRVPGDRAIAHRSLVFASVASGFSMISNCPTGDEIGELVTALISLGARIGTFGDSGMMMVTGTELHEPGGPIEPIRSRDAAALLAAIAAAFGISLDLSLDAEVRELLRHAGEGGIITLARPDAILKSVALAANLHAAAGTHIEGDRGTPDHTERLLERLGADVRWNGTNVDVKPGRLTGTEIEIPGDFSAAAGPLAAAAATPGSALELPNIGVNPTRTILLDLLAAMGSEIARDVAIELGGEAQATLRVTGTSLRAVHVDGPTVAMLGDDIFPLAVAAVLARGRSTFGGGEARTFARIAALLRVFGANVERVADGYAIEGCPEKLQAPSGSVPTFGDFRVAAAAAALSGIAGTLALDDTGPLERTFPGLITAWTTRST